MIYGDLSRKSHQVECKVQTRETTEVLCVNTKDNLYEWPVCLASGTLSSVPLHKSANVDTWWGVAHRTASQREKESPARYRQGTRQIQGRVPTIWFTQTQGQSCADKSTHSLQTLLHLHMGDHAPIHADPDSTLSGTMRTALCYLVVHLFVYICMANLRCKCVKVFKF